MYYTEAGLKNVLIGPEGLQGVGPDPCVASSLDFDGEVLGYSQGGCGEARVATRDLGAGTPPESQTSTIAHDVEVAGDYVAWTESDPPDAFLSGTRYIVVFNRRSRREVLRIDVTKLVGPTTHGYGVAYDIQADGTVAFVYVNGDGVQPASVLAFASPSAPEPRIVATNIAGLNVAIADGLVAVKRRTANPEVEEFAVLDLNGATIQVFDYDEAHWATGEIAFDGKRLAWASHLLGLQTSPFPVIREVPSQEPTVTRFSIRPRRFAPVDVAPVRSASDVPRGTTLRFNVESPARIVVRIQRKRRTRWRSVGRVRLGERYGSVAKRFPGRLNGRALKAGRYRAVIFARRIELTVRTRERSAGFRILRP